MYPGKLIVVDGMDGAGKTTAIDYMKQELKRRDIDAEVVSVWLTNPFSHLCRSVIVRPEQGLHPVEALSVAIAGVLHSYHQHVVPLLEQGKTVLLDRGPRSSLALQVAPYVDSSVWFSKAHAPALATIWNAAFEHFHIDREISLVIDANVAAERMLSRSGKLDGIEAKGVDWHANTRYAYTVDKRPEDIVENNGQLSTLMCLLDPIVEGIAQMSRKG